MKQGEITDWSLSGLGVLFVKTVSNGWAWLGIGSLLLFLVSFMVVLSWADYSFVMPASASSYAGGGAPVTSDREGVARLHQGWPVQVNPSGLRAWGRWALGDPWADAYGYSPSTASRWAQASLGLRTLNEFLCWPFFHGRM